MMHVTSSMFQSQLHQLSHSEFDYSTSLADATATHSMFISCVIGFAVLDCWLYLHCWLLQLLWSIAVDFSMFYLICRFPHADSTFRCSASTPICMHLSQCNFSSWKEDNTQNNTPLTALFRDYPAGFYWTKRVGGSGINWAICKSAPCPRQIHVATLNLLQAGCRSCHPTNSVKALKGK